MSNIITRFAPSPTGYMHVGNLRTGLFAWLTARHANGTFILRLEDTDKKREVEGSADHILACLDILGLERDEGIDVGGPHTPYRQSERLDIYREWAQRLIASGRAYADPYSSAEVQAFREKAQSEKRPFLYRNHRPKNPLPWDGTVPLRFKSEPKSYQWHDLVMGDLQTGPEVIDDFVLIKSDGFPTYNFAHIVDDAEMGVTHVIRGQEFISSMPNYLNLYEALAIDHPLFATVPHILNESGNKKLGKRDGAKDVLQYIEEGILPEALLSFIATLGWNDGTEQEIFTRDELIKKFSLERVQKGGARFDERRLLWMNGQWIRRLSLDNLYSRVEPFWPKAAADHDSSYKMAALKLARDRLKTLADLPTVTSFLFITPKIDQSILQSHKQLKKVTSQELAALLRTVIDTLSGLDNFSDSTIQAALNDLLDQTGQPPMILFGITRIATTWAPFSPDLAPSLALLGKDEVLARLISASDFLAAH